ncbi:hypothetical protein [Candidatus Enterovibrio escicola]|uniref:hypothetical protein n=1 Tax=Candidatus Enterovibrio escicola TaxID=1927127 RepID=UPI0030D817B5
MMSYTKRISYLELFEEVAGRNPLKCVFCGREIDLIILSHLKHGVLFNLFASNNS